MLISQASDFDGQLLYLGESSFDKCLDLGDAFVLNFNSRENSAQKVRKVSSLDVAVGIAGNDTLDELENFGDIAVLNQLVNLAP